MPRVCCGSRLRASLLAQEVDEVGFELREAVLRHDEALVDDLRQRLGRVRVHLARRRIGEEVREAQALDFAALLSINSSGL